MLIMMHHRSPTDKAEAQTFMRSLSTNEVCAKCNVTFNVAVSFGVEYSFDKLLCVNCTTQEQDPFYRVSPRLMETQYRREDARRLPLGCSRQVVSTLFGPLKITTEKTEAGFRYMHAFEDDEVVEVWLRIITTYSCHCSLRSQLSAGYRVFLRPFPERCLKFNGHREKHPARPRLPQHWWPLQSTLSVNGTNVPIVQGEWKTQPRGSVAFKGHSLAVDITRHVVRGRNTITIKRYPKYEPVHWFVVQVLEKKSVENVVKVSGVSSAATASVQYMIWEWWCTGSSFRCAAPERGRGSCLYTADPGYKRRRGGGRDVLILQAPVSPMRSHLCETA